MTRPSYGAWNCLWKETVKFFCLCVFVFISALSSFCLFPYLNCFYSVFSFYLLFDFIFHVLVWFDFLFNSLLKKYKAGFYLVNRGGLKWCKRKIWHRQKQLPGWKTDQKRKLQRIIISKKKKYEKYIKGHEFLIIPETFDAVNARIISLLSSDVNSRKLIGVSRETMEYCAKSLG